MKFYWVGLLCLGMAYAAPPPVPSAGVVERELEKEYKGKPLEPTKEIPSIQIDIPEERLDDFSALLLVGSSTPPYTRASMRETRLISAPREESFSSIFS
jgi:hypothetical protein